MDEEALWAKLRKIEALHAGTHYEGEREAARRAAAARGKTPFTKGLPPVRMPCGCSSSSTRIEVASKET